MARYTHTLNGAFEVYQSRNGNHVLRQQSDQTSTGVGSAWNAGDPVTTIGDFRWTNYTAAVDVCNCKIVKTGIGADRKSTRLNSSH